MRLKILLELRDRYPVDSKEWNKLNEKKARLLEEERESLKENILFYEEKQLGNIPIGFSKIEELSLPSYQVDRRSLLEYHPLYRQPVVYAYLEYEDEVFLVKRTGGEGRLLGSFGFLGGHVDKKDISSTLDATLRTALFRELNEEVGVEKIDVKQITLLGFIKETQAVGSDHLGCIYRIILDTKEIAVLEVDEMKGMWVEKEKLAKYLDVLEDWAKTITLHEIIYPKNSLYRND